MSLKNELKSNGNWLFKYRSYLPLLLFPLLILSLKNENYFTNNLLLLISFIISILGLFIRIITIAYVPVGTSGRNTKKQRAKYLNKNGIYSIVRHPLYLGNFLIYLGPFIFTANLYIIFIFLLLFVIYYERIMYAEEAFLLNKFGKEYDEWSSKTPAFIPNIKLYKKSSLKLSLKKIINREYTGICGIVFLFIFLIFVKNIFNSFSPLLSNFYIYTLLINTFIYLILRFMKKINRSNYNVK